MNNSRLTQKDIAVLWQIAELARIDKTLRKMSIGEFAEWVSIQLAESLQVYTRPVGARYHHLCSKEEYEQYLADSVS